MDPLRRKFVSLKVVCSVPGESQTTVQCASVVSTLDFLAGAVKNDPHWKYRSYYHRVTLEGKSRCKNCCSVG